MNNKILNTTYTFDDVLMIPNYSNIKSRSEVSLRSKFSKNIPLNIPIVSSPMDTVSTENMCIHMALNGGLGILHRFCSIEEQVRMIKQVKKFMTFIIDDPYCVHTDDTIQQVKELSKKYNVGSFLVKNNNLVVGIITRRDYENVNENTTVEQVMSKNLITSNNLNITMKDAKEIMQKNKVEKLILNNEKLICLKDILRLEEYNNANIDSHGKLYVGCAIGNQDYKERLSSVIDAGVDCIVIDIAHGHSQNLIEVLDFVKQNYTIDVICGSVCTASACKLLIDHKADGIRVGVGSGAICSTRLITGFGVPQLSAVLDCAEICKNYDVPLISDGGIRMSNHICKALGAGASSVMIGSLLAGCDESPTMPVIRNNKQYKLYRGMASITANLTNNELKNKVNKDLHNLNVEGIESYVLCCGQVKNLLNNFCVGLRSSLSYGGAHNLDEFYDKIKFIPITNNGVVESDTKSVKEL